MSNKIIAVGIYQDENTAIEVLGILKTEGFRKSNLINEENHGSSKYCRYITKDETLIQVDIRPKDASKVVNILTRFSSENVVTYLFETPCANLIDSDARLPSVPLSTEEMSEETISLAKEMKKETFIQTKSTSLLTELKSAEKILYDFHGELLEADKLGQTKALSVQWILDNFYLIKTHIKDVFKNLPKKYYRELPKIKDVNEYPKIYVLAMKLIEIQDGKLDAKNITEFLKSYQTIDYLTIGELWAYPLFLKLGLIKCLKNLVLMAAIRQRDGESAGFFGNRLLNFYHKDKDSLPRILDDLKSQIVHPSPHFAEELVDHLFDEDVLLASVKEWLESTYQENISDILLKDQMEEAAEQVSMANSITSLIFLTQLDFRKIFKEVCKVESILNEDPSGTFKKLSFKTSDIYLHAIEKLAKRSGLSELEVANETYELSKSGKNSLKQHVGYYLIDEGREKLEERIKYNPSILEKVRKTILKHPTAVYLGSLVLFTSILLFLAIHFFAEPIPLKHLILFLALAIIPATELILQIQNIVFAIFLKPFILPKLEFKDGIPTEFKSLIVIPVLLNSQESIESHIKNLEIRYLANEDPELKFSLFTDFIDSKSENAEDDERLLKIAVDGIHSLESKYGKGTFFLFHRKRRWSASENAYIGEERKRGKLEALNRFLLEKTEDYDENILYAGNLEDLKNIRYVITLDADTELPKNQALKLIETIAHPLNEAVLDNESKKVLRGYTLIQPRVTTSLPSSNKTYFSRIFSGAIGSDPYTEAVSDIYQDMLHEGSYQGKGIYDLNVFHTVLDKRFPNDHILSHDLIEGAYTRVGFASGIELLDEFPENYEIYAKREHRWIRGDWQIIDWLMPFVPTGFKIQAKNTLSYMNRWKIFDNLRRSLLPCALFLLVVLASLLLKNYFIFISFAWIVLFIPSVAMILFRSFAPKLELELPSEQIKNSILKNIIMLSVLPYEAYLTVDAIVRVIYRRLISKKNLLQWTIQDKVKNHKSSFYWKLSVGSIAGIAALIGTYLLNREALFAIIPFSLFWILSPIIIYLTGKSIYEPLSNSISSDDKLFLRQIGRKTWGFFDRYVTEESNWLPPDNFQESYGQGVAFRTSPTNIGLYLLSIYTAYDFGYITVSQAIRKCGKTVDSILKLELYDGHLLNWYDIKTLQPLLPKYVSTVDSGNLLGCLWTLEQTITDSFFEEILSDKTFQGLTDTLHSLDVKNLNAGDEAKLLYDQLDCLFAENPKSLDVKINILEEALSVSSKLLKVINEELSTKPEINYWAAQIHAEIKEWNEAIDQYFPWMTSLQSVMDQIPEAKEFKKMIDEEPISLYALAEDEIESLHELLTTLKNVKSLNVEEINALNEFENLFAKAKASAKALIDEGKETLTKIHKLGNEMNMRFLYNESRKVFTIGYHVNDCKLDNSYYDLLASEARLASFVSIAKNDAPLEHWFALGRSFSLVEGQKVLLSWGGTMFEYLMPLLLTKSYKKSLLDEACHATVACQIEYGSRRGIPWGISESAFSALDARKTYQYQSFGVPRLGLKRGLEDDLVVSPYSTGLALMVEAQASISNLKRLMHSMHLSLFGSCGFYESVDYTRQHGPHGERGVVIHAYMAHHQGMMFISINNLLNDGIMQNRFHKDPRVESVESLLYERLPLFTSINKDYTRNAPVARLRSLATPLNINKIDTANTPKPKVNLLSNGNYSVMMTNSGTGYSHYNQIEISRFSPDPTSNELGSFVYIKDLHSKKYWSSTYQPTKIEPDSYLVNFTSDKIEFKRHDQSIETVTEIVVSPEDHAEIRRMTFTNLSKLKRHLELTSFMEISLAPHSNDKAHPVFNKIFIQTEVSHIPFGLIATRRLRSETEEPLFIAHLLVSNDHNDTILQYETDRGEFIGRGRSLENPKSLENTLSNTTGAVLDPIFSLRKQVVLDPNQRLQVSFVTLYASSEEKLRQLMTKYTDFSATNRAIEMSWTYSQLQLRHLRIHPEEAKVFQKLAGKIIYPQSNLRGSSGRLKGNLLKQSDLWQYGISGDIPILAVTIGDVADLSLVKEMLVAHTFLNTRGLKCDIVFLNEEQTAYDQPVRNQISKLIQSHHYHAQAASENNVFLLSLDQMPEDHLELILTVARVVFVSARGPLKDQLIQEAKKVKEIPKLPLISGKRESLSEVLPFMELNFFNGLGGFTKDGSEYIIYLEAGKTTPAPWINVIANSEFGMTVSESGIGSCWFGNSQTNRLTPWSNDPLLDPISDLIYIRDDELGVFWSSTPSPIRELDPYRIRHGQGYSVFEHNSHGINQELTVFVPMQEGKPPSLRVQKLKLKNITDKKRKLTLMGYSELVLGGQAEDTRFFVVTEWDSELRALYAKNTYNSDYGSRVTFASCTPNAEHYTADRVEFIGRNSSGRTPSALSKKNLSDTTGTAIDPCMGLQVTIELEPGEIKEAVFILGQAADITEAKELVRFYQNHETIEISLKNSKEWWSNVLKTIQVETPDMATNYLLNNWLLYQNLSCRVWGRSAFYQSSGAYGYRDQLQDVMALLYSKPEISRNQILRAAAHQFLEGDVQHWWHPKSNGGIRTRITDDLLWLPFVTAQYLRVTNDLSILNEEVSFLKGPVLEENQDELYFVPEITQDKSTLLEHCRRAIIKGTTKGSNGIPLIGTGDWNDGMNRVGIEGKGESVWLGFFLIHVLNDFVEILEKTSGDKSEIEGYKTDAMNILLAIEKNGWDGEWYKRAFYDDGTPIGSAESMETKIDSLPQSWSVISASVMTERSQIAMESARKYLLNENERLLMILTNPFDKTPKDPGYIKGYPPGIRENGGQYTHGSLWVPLAFARLNRGQEAVDILQIMNPIKRSLKDEDVAKYAIEPYIIPADIYTNPNHLGKGGWSWYTGSAAWMYRIWLEEVLGLKVRGDVLSLKPVVPDDWKQFKIRYRYGSSYYNIEFEVKGSEGYRYYLDGVEQNSAKIQLQDDGKEHTYRVTNF